MWAVNGDVGQSSSRRAVEDIDIGGSRRKSYASLGGLGDVLAAGYCEEPYR